MEESPKPYTGGSAWRRRCRGPPLRLGAPPLNAGHLRQPDIEGRLQDVLQPLNGGGLLRLPRRHLRLHDLDELVHGRHSGAPRLDGEERTTKLR